WGLALPVIALGLAWPTRGWSLLLLALYPLIAARVYFRMRRDASNSKSESGRQRRPVGAYTFFTVLGKFPQALGQGLYMLARMRGCRNRVIEYKGPKADIMKEPA